jgi:hypothetical protein
MSIESDKDCLQKLRKKYREFGWLILYKFDVDRIVLVGFLIENQNKSEYREINMEEFLVFPDNVFALIDVYAQMIVDDILQPAVEE